ncbi:MAG: putative toxin-antitoxin system toxin component, PIN family [Mucilaginibacter sp.]|nr:putative toxin-antitoxin system toxin component, PIN family [Mucilaginibacter sp.]
MKKTNRFVLDTNTLVSAFLLSENSIAAQAYYEAKSKGQLICSDDTFNEFSDIFIRPKFDRYVQLSKRLAIIEDLRTLLNFTSVSISLQACRDPKDNKFLELAVEADASCIITGDKDLLVLNPFNKIPILTAAQFIETF